MCGGEELAADEGVPSQHRSASRQRSGARRAQQPPAFRSSQ